MNGGGRGVYWEFIQNVKNRTHNSDTLTTFIYQAMRYLIVKSVEDIKLQNLGLQLSPPSEIDRRLSGSLSSGFVTAGHSLILFEFKITVSFYDDGLKSWYPLLMCVCIVELYSSRAQKIECWWQIKFIFIPRIGLINPSR